jgi:hypothetical protein
MIVALLRQRLTHSCATFLFIRVDLPTPGPKLASLNRRNDPLANSFRILKAHTFTDAVSKKIA